jgi:hypothetical protein
MIDFTVKGTKLPTVPAGTQYSVGKSELFTFECTRDHLVSFGSEWINGERFIAVESPTYAGKNFWYVKLWDIQQLATEQGMISKELPKYWVVKCDTTHPDWMKVVDYMNTLSGGWTGKNNGEYYGFDGNRDNKGTNVWVNLRQFINNPTVLTIEEFVSLTNQKISNMIKITREQLHSIHKIACSEWQTKIHRIAERFPFSNEIELSKEEVDQMFKAAQPHQLPVLEGIFGARPKDINLKSLELNAQVDGISIFGTSQMDRTDALIGLPRDGSAGFNVFYLNKDYRWTYDPANETLIVNRK